MRHLFASLASCSTEAPLDIARLACCRAARPSEDRRAPSISAAREGGEGRGGLGWHGVVGWAGLPKGWSPKIGWSAWGSGVGAMRARRGARRERVAPHVERRRYSAGLQPARCSHLHAADNCEGVPRMGLAGTAQRHARVASHLLIVPGCRCTCGFEGNSPTAAGRNNNAPLRGQACLPPP